MPENQYSKDQKIKAINSLLNDCLISHNEDIIVQLIYRLELEYRQLAELSTMGEYKATWTHNDVLDYITYNL
jgi:hypothetical protein